jgi:hypothetical protein
LPGAAIFAALGSAVIEMDHEEIAGKIASFA